MTTTPYFSHDVNAQRDDKCVRLLQTLGWKGYGVYWAIIERLHEQKECSLEYNPKGLAWSLHIAEKYLVRVLTEFGLFSFSEDGQTFWSNSARRRRAYRARAPKEDPAEETPKRKRGRPRKNPLPAPPADPAPNPEQKKEIVKPAKPQPEPVKEEAPKNDRHEPETKDGLNKPASKKEASSEEQRASKASEKQSPSATGKEDPKDSPKIPVESIIASWNKTFAGTRQTYKGLYLDSISFQRAKEAFALGYTFDHVEEAFRIARSDSFCWLLKDVLKPDNIQRLLIKGDKAQNDKSNSVLSAGSGASTTSGDDWGNPDKWSRFEFQQE